jgi:SAM-dependent methyltransferase
MGNLKMLHRRHILAAAGLTLATPALLRAQANVSIPDAMMADGRFASFMELLERSPALNLLRGAGRFTVFAPTDAGVNTIPATLRAGFTGVAGGPSASAGDAGSPAGSPALGPDGAPRRIPSQQRLGARAAAVQWLEADILTATLPDQAYDVWHDRAVFHFLTGLADQQAYVRAVLQALKPGGTLLLATFAVDGPTTCSGLPVVRYSPERLQETLGTAFLLLGHERFRHRTPGGGEQHFLYCRFQRTSP